MIEASVPPPQEIGALAYTDLRLRHIGFADVFRTLFRTYPRRTLYTLVLMASQAFFYNAIFFTYALVLARFYKIPEDHIGLYILPFAVGNFLGPLVLGRLFDVLGRRPMIALTYAMSGILLAVTAALFVGAHLSAAGQTLAWCIVFFFASAAASSAYLTAGESFPLEMRALAIAVFYALGTGIGGAVGPWLFGTLVGTGARGAVAMGYLLGAALMLTAAALTPRFGIAAERRPLEWVAAPLSTCPSPSPPMNPQARTAIDPGAGPRAGSNESPEECRGLSPRVGTAARRGT
jgi:MFS family permease